VLARKNLKNLMTKPAESDEARRKRLRFRSWHRGIREMDIIMGSFVDANIADMTSAELDELELLIDVPDPDLYAAISGTRPLPSALEGPLFLRMKAYGLSGAAKQT
jgi:antitoxin CptB